MPLRIDIAGSSTAARALDQFFTKGEIAATCIAASRGLTAARGGDWLWIEPAAGEGAFLDRLPLPRMGIDVDSQRTDIVHADFLQWHPGETQWRIIVIGNPPFGKNASLARAFVNHAASFADLIAFILPRTFQKQAFTNRLHPYLHLILERDIDDAAFEFVGAPRSIPTVFQVWERREHLRVRTEHPTNHAHFRFTTAEQAHFAFQRVGARAGLVSVEGLCKSPQSHYFIRAVTDRDELFDRLRGIDWSEIKARTAGNPSIGKGELIAAYTAALA